MARSGATRTEELVGEHLAGACWMQTQTGTAYVDPRGEIRVKDFVKTCHLSEYGVDFVLLLIGDISRWGFIEGTTSHKRLVRVVFRVLQLSLEFVWKPEQFGPTNPSTNRSRSIPAHCEEQYVLPWADDNLVTGWFLALSPLVGHTWTLARRCVIKSWTCTNTT